MQIKGLFSRLSVTARCDSLMGMRQGRRQDRGLQRTKFHSGVSKPFRLRLLHYRRGCLPLELPRGEISCVNVIGRGR